MGLCKPCLPICRASTWTCRHHEYGVVQPQEPQACSSPRDGPWLLLPWLAVAPGREDGVRGSEGRKWEAAEKGIEPLMTNLKTQCFLKSYLSSANLQFPTMCKHIYYPTTAPTTQHIPYKHLPHNTHQTHPHMPHTNSSAHKTNPFLGFD